MLFVNKWGKINSYLANEGSKQDGYEKSCENSDLNVRNKSIIIIDNGHKI